MRALVFVAVGLLASEVVSASPPRKPRPQAQDVCKTASSLELLTTCLARFGKPSVIWTAPHLELIELTHGGSDAGALLYHQQGNQWAIAGMSYQSDGVLDVKPLTIGKHTGYRLEFERHRPTLIALDDGSSVPATLATRSSLFCHGDSSWCTEVITACDIRINGRTYRTFRGTVKLEADVVEIIGDRAHGGECVQPERVALGWN
ncbi:MAG: hypothetical protein JWO36_1784 [Myxococcales bacterium]|nr:hypothetical protein [Myxococcales bacterium]